MSLKKRLKKDPTVSQSVPIKRAINDIIQNAPEYGGKVLLAKSYFKNDGSPSTDPTGWWQSEKLDGYRAVWTGSKFVSRAGKEFVAPEWFKKFMPPKVPMDGELWMGRQAFETAGGLRMKKPDDKVWIKVQYHVFDLPTVAQPFETRKDLIEVLTHHIVDAARDLIQTEHPSIKQLLGRLTSWKPVMPVVHKKVKNKAQVQADLDRIVAQGGEGLMLRKPKSLYESKRSGTLLKVKKAFDAECRIIGYKPGAGKYKGKLGAFHCQLLAKPEITFYLSGMTDAIRTTYKATHPVGTVVTFTYNEFSKKGVPRFPRYLRIRVPE
jgi:DNA ligase-1